MSLITKQFAAKLRNIKYISNIPNSNLQICRRCQSTFLQTVDQTLQFSTTNPLYQGTVSLFDAVHASTGLPWWLSIVATTFCIRSLIHVPLMIAAQRSQAKLTNLKPELEEEVKSVAVAVKHAKWVHKLNNEQYRKSLRDSTIKAKRDFYHKHNVHPMKGVAVVMTQVPVWVVISLTLRNMTGYFGLPPHTGFSSGGGLWFSNLLALDPTYIIPISLGAVTLLNMSVGRKVNPATTSLNEQMIRIEKKSGVVMYSLALGIGCLAATQPSAISLFWLTSAMFSLLQSLLFAVPTVRRAVGIPARANEPNIGRLFKRD